VIEVKHQYLSKAHQYTLSHNPHIITSPVQFHRKNADIKTV